MNSKSKMVIGWKLICLFLAAQGFSWWLFSNRVSLEAIYNKSTSLFFSPRVPSAPHWFSLLSHYHLLFISPSSIEQLPLSILRFYLSFCHSLLIWRSLPSLTALVLLLHLRPFCYFPLVSCTFLHLQIFFLHAPLFPISAYILISSLSSMFCMTG